MKVVEAHLKKLVKTRDKAKEIGSKQPGWWRIFVILNSLFYFRRMI